MVVMTWIVLLIVFMCIGMAGAYLKTGEKYSAGRGFFNSSEYNLDDKDNKNISDYEPWEHNKMRK